jgi:hypothetical protein
MARVIVTADDGTTLMDEHVIPAALDDERYAVQLLEQQAWALQDAEQIDRVTYLKLAG